jgi:hypothetical protein
MQFFMTTKSQDKPNAGVVIAHEQGSTYRIFAADTAAATEGKNCGK